MHGLSQSVACGIFPDQRSNPCLLPFVRWQADSFPLSHWGRPTHFSFKRHCPWEPVMSYQQGLHAMRKSASVILQTAEAMLASYYKQAAVTRAGVAEDGKATHVNHGKGKNVSDRPQETASLLKGGHNQRWRAENVKCVQTFVHSRDGPS